MLGRFSGIIGVIVILALAFVFSNNRQKINLRLVISGLVIQFLLAVFVLKIPFGQELFKQLGDAITALLSFSDTGSAFVFGFLVSHPDKLRAIFGEGSQYIFAFRVVPTIIFVSSLVSISYYLGIMQAVVKVVAKVVAFLMGVSGAEALSNAASVFVGQVEAQLLIKPYVPSMTMSELLASMAGSMACVSGGVLAVYIGLGIKASYLLTASIMAAPGALVISKIIYPETEVSKTKGEVKLEINKTNVNLIDAASHGASEGLRIGLNVVAMLIAFIALISLIDSLLALISGKLALWGFHFTSLGFSSDVLNLKDIFGKIFAPIAYLIGVPPIDTSIVGKLMGEKLAINEFVAFTDLANIVGHKTQFMISKKAELIASFALCGFANFSSVAIQVGGIGEIAPNRKRDVAQLGLKALLCGTMASYLSAAIAGLLI